MGATKSPSRIAQAISRDVVGLQGVGCRVRPHLPPTQTNGANQVTSALIRQQQREVVSVADAWKSGFLCGITLGCFGIVPCVFLALWIRG